jgi:DNA/RNA endonuclease YhcR with UshA esterase domain
MKRFAVLAVVISLTLIAIESRADEMNTVLFPIGSAEAAKWIGKQVVVTGAVAQVSVRSSLVFMNFDGAYPSNMFAAIIRNKNNKEFVNLSALGGKAVCVKGRIKDYKGKPEMELTGESQLEVLNK